MSAFSLSSRLIQRALFSDDERSHSAVHRQRSDKNSSVLANFRLKFHVVTCGKHQSPPLQVSAIWLDSFALLQSQTKW